ncbi:hypothetical protein DV736_g892, partial [Chaetothyriales sp. CBS 134916]
MRSWISGAVLLAVLACTVQALRYEAEFVGHNLNENRTALEPKDYWGQWDDHTFMPSPRNWRIPFYVLTIDRFVDGDPTNNEANGTVFEHQWMSNQFRFGGDTTGVLNNLDYLQGMGIKSIYFTGSMMLNMPWECDGYGPLDFTLLDKHHGDIQAWRSLIDEIHKRDMYVIFDNTVSTMGNLLAYAEPYTNATVEFTFDEHEYIWADPERRYHDFQPGNDWDAACQMPHIWEQDGYPETQAVMDDFKGCRDSEFDMYGDIKGTGAYPSYINQLSRFASVQDRLREWRSDVLEKIKVMSCIQIAMLDIDGFRIDKAVQVNLDALADFSTYQRECARRFGKENFLMVGEVVSDPRLAANYFGRGKMPDQALEDPSLAVYTNSSQEAGYIRDFGETALDGAAFHYDIYGSLTRFLGLDGPWGSQGVDWVEFWHNWLREHDFVNANTGLFDPRHMFGTTNQDVFRWPALANGAERQLLGMFITTLELPGIPMIMFGEEQKYYTLENLAPDYVYGRAPMVSQRAWQLHGCYNLGEELYVNMPFNSSSYGCYDDGISLDRRDPSHPMRNIIKRFFELRQQYPVLNDGFNLTTLSTRIYDIYLPGSQGMPSPHGMWSVYRGRNTEAQDFTGESHGNQPVWLLFHNENRTVTYDFNCESLNSSSADGSMISAFSSGVTVKNLFYPYDTYTLNATNFTLGLEGSPELNGCIPQITMEPWQFKAFVPVEEWEEPRPVITGVVPGHDSRITSTVQYDQQESIPIEIRFSTEMNCDSVMNSFAVQSATQTGQTAALNLSSVVCQTVAPGGTQFVAQAATQWIFKAMLDNVSNGVHTYTISNATSSTGATWTNARDRFMFRIGQPDNPMVFPESSNYTRGLLQKDSDKTLFVIPRAAGADKVRYSTNWGTSFSSWESYTGERINIQMQSWSGTKAQEWKGEHVILQYWSAATGSSDHVQHSDLEWSDRPARRWPHAWVEGDFNQWGFDGGLETHMSQDDLGTWNYHLFTEWPANITINVWGMNPDGLPDKSAAYGDLDRDGVLDLVWPNSISQNVINISAVPSNGYIGYILKANDGNYSYKLVPHGSQTVQAVVIAFLCFVPIITGVGAVYAFRCVFYRVKLNKVGIQPKRNRLQKLGYRSVASLGAPRSLQPSRPQSVEGSAVTSPVALALSHPRTILLATLEYLIEEWGIKIKIGGLGVMAALMAKHLKHHQLVWVIPCVGGVDYPFEPDSEARPIIVQVSQQSFKVQVHVHVIENITYFLLDAPVFRRRTKAEPYPPRMDDFESAVYYSTWNQCIAEICRRVQPDLYHINDFHGACAPLYLLPQTIPVCVSLHNAEFQGMWPLKTSEQSRDIARIFNLDRSIVREYVQFGEVFNMLHAAASYLRIHQDGFGAVGVSTKYGKRSLARYPIFWGLRKIGALPNPDPSDTAPFDGDFTRRSIIVDPEKERQHAADLKLAQEWAGLEVDAEADLFVFVGRWSVQKGVDLIADVFPSVLEQHPKTQLVCIGPVIDLYGRFAALKLDKLMAKYPRRVFSKPEFTELPPYLFSGAEFALMPSRDEPFGLVAVEFGRKGALCIGARVGGLGNMPGWWFTVESVTSRHLVHQLKSAIDVALASDRKTRASMRAYSAIQRFPVASWVAGLEALQVRSMEMSVKQKVKHDPLKKLKTKLTVKETLSTSDSASDERVSRVMTSNNASTSEEDVSVSDYTGLVTPPNELGFGALSTMSSRTFPLDDAITSQGNSTVNSPFASHVLTPLTCRSEVSLASADTSAEIDDIDELERGRPVEWHVNRHSFSQMLAQPPAARIKKSVVPTFSDSRKMYQTKFSQNLQDLNVKTSVTSLSVESFVMKSEKDWYAKYHSAALGSHQSVLSLPYISTTPRSSSRVSVRSRAVQPSAPEEKTEYDELLGDDYQAPRGCRRLLQYKIGDWNIYCFLLAFGQIMCASPHQLTLLIGSVGDSSMKLYILCAIYVAASFAWWIVYRTHRAIYCLAGPFIFFGCCFAALGFSICTHDKQWIFNVASGLYTAGSAASSLFFSLNFGSEGGTPTAIWTFRACAVAGTQQLLIAFMWYWGSVLATTSGTGGPSSVTLTAVSFPMMALMFTVGVLLFLGLPDYYRQQPGTVPSFYRALCKKGIVLWFWFMVAVQCYWLSAPYNRNWLFLWSTNNAPMWAIALLVIFFFGFMWAGMLVLIGHLSREDTWLPAIFAVGLGAPRWCQMLWSLSGIAYYIPWAGLTGGALISRGIWLWLGVLDGLQGIGFGMILLMTLPRFHIAFTLMAAQTIGACFTIVARATSQDKIGTSGVWLNLANDSLRSWSFWVALAFQLVICVGYLKFFRKAQLTKP